MNYKKVAAFLWIQFLFICQHALVLARAGGGHSSRSSSSGSPSSWGGSSHHSASSLSGPSSWGGGSYVGSSGSSFWVVFFIIAIVIIVVLPIVLILFFRRKKTALGEMDAVSQGVAPDVRFAPNLADKIVNLKNKDPGFNEQMFQDKISTVFFEIENAWCGRDMGPARQFLSDAVYSRFHLQLEAYLRKDTFNRLDELSLDRATILDIRSDENYDTIDVWVTATARDYVVDEKGKIVSGSTELTTWDEKWSFMRSVKATTQIKEGIKVAKCPNCGAPTEINAAGECGYCHAKMNRYDFDWVLTEIEQLNIT